MSLASTLDAQEILNREFLEIRAKLLQVAATLDRLDRAGGDDGEGTAGENSVADDARMTKIHQALAIVAGAESDRAERLQLLFSLPYEPNWKQTFALGKRP